MELSKGDEAIDFSLEGIDGRKYSLNDFSSKKALLIIFMCNHCPYVKSKIDEIKRISEEYEDLAVVGISSNDPVRFPEDSLNNMKKTAQEKGFNFPYLFDETQEIAKAYGAVCTPDPFLFGPDRKLVFHSRIDEGGTKPGTGQEMYKAVGELLEIGTVTQKENPPFGCSIKWKVE